MSLRSILTCLCLVAAALLLPGATGSASAAPTTTASAERLTASARAACTRNGKKTCIKRGQVCPASQRGKTAVDNRGRSNVCRAGKGGKLRWQAPQKAKPARRCDPNYAGACVPIASDVDCAGGSGNGPAYVQGPVRVIGKDIYDLDRDGDGVGCD